MDIEEETNSATTPQWPKLLKKEAKKNKTQNSELHFTFVVTQIKILQRFPKTNQLSNLMPCLAACCYIFVHRFIQSSKLKANRSGCNESSREVMRGKNVSIFY